MHFVGGLRCNFVGQRKINDQYWESDAYLCKRPVVNGSKKMLVGDNIYHWAKEGSAWSQADSHHSLPDGSADVTNVINDTSTNRVLISRHFVYFGREAPHVPECLLEEIGYTNRRAHRTFDGEQCKGLLSWLNNTYGRRINHVLGDPHQFDDSGARYSAGTNRITSISSRSGLRAVQTDL